MRSMRGLNETWAWETLSPWVGLFLKLVEPIKMLKSSKVKTQVDKNLRTFHVLSTLDLNIIRSDQEKNLTSKLVYLWNLANFKINFLLLIFLLFQKLFLCDRFSTSTILHQQLIFSFSQWKLANRQNAGVSNY